MLPTYSFGVMTVVLTIGSLISSISLGTGNCEGLSHLITSPLVLSTSYSTEGAVDIKSKSYSLSNLSRTTSIWSVPKKPHLKPKPNASETSGSYINEESLRTNFDSASLNFS